MHTSSCSLDPDITFNWEALLVYDKYRGGHSQPATVREPEKGAKDLKGFAVPQEEQ